jgi:hypothetical protein
MATAELQIACMTSYKRCCRNNKPKINKRKPCTGKELKICLVVSNGKELQSIDLKIDKWKYILH